MGRVSQHLDRSVKDSYIKEYDIDLENRFDRIEKCMYSNRIFCVDCKKYHMQGRGRNRKIIRKKQGCKGTDLEWKYCLYRKLAMEVIENE